MIPTNTRAKHDCLRCCVASLLEVDANLLPYIPPSPYDPEDLFWPRWNGFFEDNGIDIEIWIPDDPNKPQKLIERFGDKYWIAAVNTLGSKNSRHAIIMKGSKVVFDSAKYRPRKKTPQKIYYGMEIKEGEE